MDQWQLDGQYQEPEQHLYAPQTAYVAHGGDRILRRWHPKRPHTLRSYRVEPPRLNEELFFAHPLRPDPDVEGPGLDARLPWLLPTGLRMQRSKGRYVVQLVPGRTIRVLENLPDCMYSIVYFRAGQD